jgi:hypothetical protein
MYLLLMARDVIVLMRANPFRGPLEDVGPENRDFFWALKWQRAKRVPFGTKKGRVLLQLCRYWYMGGRVPSDDTNTEPYYDNFGGLSLTIGLLLGLYSRGREVFGGYPFSFLLSSLFFYCKARRRKVSLKERESAQKKGFLIKGECTEMK